MARRRLSVVLAIGWLAFLLSSAIPAIWATARAIERNPQGRYVDLATGEWTPALYHYFFIWWLPVLVPVLLLACACLFLDRRRGRPPD